MAKRGRPRKYLKIDIQENKTTESSNPFQIEDNVPLTKRGSGSELSIQFLEKLTELPVDNKSAIVITTSIIPSKREAASLVNGVRSIIAKLPKNDPRSQIAIASKSFKDAKGYYVSTRIWRLQ
jgi:hypothetical protein